MNKVVRIPLICAEPDIDYKDIYKYLFALQKETRAVKNKAVQKCWEFNNFSSDYKKEYGTFPKVEDVMPLKTLSGNINSELKTEFSSLYSANLSTTIRDVCAKFTNNKKEYFTGEKSIASFRSDQPLDLHNKSIKLKVNEDKSFSVELSLVSTAFKKEYSIPKCSLNFDILAKDKYQKTILERCYDGIYNITASQLLYNKKKKMWELNLGYGFELQLNTPLNPDNIMGIDLGIVYAAYMSFNCCKERYSIDGYEIEQFRRQIESRKKGLQKQGKYCCDGRVGHGTLTRIKPLETLNDKISNFRDTTNHKYSKYIVDMAIKNNCGTIQMEDLSGIAKDDKFLKTWSYFDLQTKITYKAQAAGIQVIKINPKYTSKRCSKCGCIHPENRNAEKNQSLFKCVSCGFKTNADYNASQNIATKDIDTIIKNTEISSEVRTAS